MKPNNIKYFIHASLKVSDFSSKENTGQVTYRADMYAVAEEKNV